MSTGAFSIDIDGGGHVRAFEVQGISMRTPGITKLKHFPVPTGIPPVTRFSVDSIGTVPGMRQVYPDRADGVVYPRRVSAGLLVVSPV